MIRIGFITTILLALAFGCQAQDMDKTFMLDGLQRQYLIHLPKDHNSLNKLPVIFALHGGGGYYKTTPELYSLNALADKYHYIVVYPNAIAKAWCMTGISSKVQGSRSDVDDVKFISTLMDTLIAHYNADSKRMFCTGLSRGGIFSLYLAWKLADRIKAIAPVCASITQNVAAGYHFGHPTPVLLIKGTDDPLILYNGGKGKFNPAYGAVEDYNMLSNDDLLKKILTENSIKTEPVITNMPDTDPNDGCTAVSSLYQGNGVQVKFIKVVNGGHTWPGGKQYLPKFLIGKLCKDFKAEDEIFAFFNQY